MYGFIGRVGRSQNRRKENQTKTQRIKRKSKREVKTGKKKRVVSCTQTMIP